jgi:hypothetical protein
MALFFTFQNFRGTAADMPTLADGQLYLQEDTGELWIGSSLGNIEVGGTGGTVTSVATAGIATGGPITTTGTVTVTGSGSTTTAATADTNVASAPAGDVITADGSGNVKDSGTLLSSLAPKASPALTGVPTAPTAAAATNTTQLATTAFVESEIPLRSAVTSVFARTGAVVATTGDYTQTQISAGAIANSTTATTQAALSNDTKVATDAYVDAAVAVETSRAETAEATKQATLTGVGIARNTGACTELSGDVTTSGSNAASVVQVNGAAVPASKTIVGTNGSSQIVDASSATLSNNTTGTAANLSGTPALPNGTTATTQAALSNDTKVATDAYVDSAVTAAVPFPVLSSTITLTSTQILALATTPIMCVSPVSGKIIVPTRVDFHYTNGGINYATNSSFLLEYLGSITSTFSSCAGTSTTNAAAFTAGGGFGNTSTNGFASWQLGAGTTFVGSNNSPNLVDAGVYVAATANPTAGNGTVKIVVYYYLATF